MTLTPEEERVLRSLLRKKKSPRTRRVVQSIGKRAKSKLSSDLAANIMILIILVILAIGLITK